MVGHAVGQRLPQRGTHGAAAFVDQRREQRLFPVQIVLLQITETYHSQQHRSLRLEKWERYEAASITIVIRRPTRVKYDYHCLMGQFIKLGDQRDSITAKNQPTVVDFMNHDQN